MPHRILFVDAEAPIRELLTLFFKKKGIEVTSAVSAREGLELTRGSGYDLAIVDVNLGGENGLELMAHLKREHPAMPVIMFTGLTGDENLLQEALARGADGFMRKTEPLSALYDEVQRHLPQ
jgi:DNA-binding response OmpR family regulator